MKIPLFIVAMLFTVFSLKAQQSPASAEQVLTEACQQAALENKNVFVMFHASWCVWCHRMDNSMNDAACKKFFDDNYVIRHLVVNESADKKNLENPGAEAMITKYHGDGQGIPFWLVFDKDGKLLFDSKMRNNGDGPEKGANTGCPASESEVAFFINILKKTSPITTEQAEIIRKRFRENDK
jgi:thioredoxin-related protein